MSYGLSPTKSLSISIWGISVSELAGVQLLGSHQKSITIPNGGFIMPVAQCPQRKLLTDCTSAGRKRKFCVRISFSGKYMLTCNSTGECFWPENTSCSASRHVSTWVFFSAHACLMNSQHIRVLRVFRCSAAKHLAQL